MGTGTAVAGGDAITAAKMNLKLESVDTADIAANAVSKLSTGSASTQFSTASTSFVDVTGLTTTLTTTTDPLLIFVHMGILAGDTGGRTGRITIIEDSTNIGDATYGIGIIPFDFFGDYVFARTPTAASHTYKVQMKMNAGTGYVMFGNTQAFISVLQLKR